MNQTHTHITRKLKLAIVVPEMLPVPPTQGGAVEHWVHEVSKRLNQELFEITIVSRPSSNLLKQAIPSIEYVGIPWTSLERFFYKMKVGLSWRNPLRYLAKIQNVFSYGWRMAKLVKYADLIIVHNEPNLLFFINKGTHQKIYLHMHNEHLSLQLLRKFYRKTLNKVEAIFCVSDYIRQVAVQYFPEHRNKFSVIFNATDANTFKSYGKKAHSELRQVIKIIPDNVYLLYVGRLTAQKGVHVLISAFLKAQQRQPNLRLVIAGSSFFEGAIKTHYEQSLVRLAQPVSEFILFTGFLSHEKLKYLYSAVDIVVVPSIWQDPCPLVVLEAMASAKAVIATRVGGVPEVLTHAENGFLLQPDNVSALSDAICTLGGNPDLRAKIGIAARNKIGLYYQWDRLVQELESDLIKNNISDINSQELA